MKRMKRKRMQWTIQGWIGSYHKRSLRHWSVAGRLLLLTIWKWPTCGWGAGKLPSLTALVPEADGDVHRRHHNCCHCISVGLLFCALFSRGDGILLQLLELVSFFFPADVGWHWFGCTFHLHHRHHLHFWSAFAVFVVPPAGHRPSTFPTSSCDVVVENAFQCSVTASVWPSTNRRSPVSLSMIDSVSLSFCYWLWFILSWLKQANCSFWLLVSKKWQSN